MEACFQKRFVAGGIGFEHAQPPFLGRLDALCIELHDQHLDVVLQELLADLSADAAIPANDDVVVHAPEFAAKAQSTQLAEVTGFRQTEEPLNRQLHHHHTAANDQHSHQPSSGGERFHFAVADGADGDQHHPKAVPPVPAFGDAIPEGSTADHGDQSQNRTDPGLGEKSQVGAQPPRRHPKPRAVSTSCSLS